MRRLVHPDLAVPAAIESARRVLLQTQRSDGSWEGTCDLGPTTTAYVAVALKFVGELSTEDASELARWLRARQRRDGSFVLYPSAPRGDLGATASCWAALHATAPGESAQAIARARGWVDAHGGLDGVIEAMDTGDLAAVFLAMAGLVDAKRLPCPSSSFLLARPLVKLLQTRLHPSVLMTAFVLSSLVRRLRGEWGEGGKGMGLPRWLVRHEGIALLEQFQNDNGSFNDSEVFSALALAGLHAAGLPRDDRRVSRALAWVEAQAVRDLSGLHFGGLGSEVWATAFDTRALLEGGLPPSDPAVARALGFLLDAQLSKDMPRVNNRQPNATLSGGWAFQRGNHTLPGCDEAGVVLGALGRGLAWSGPGGVDEALAARIRHSVQRGQRWLAGMQNPDGGWSAHVWGLPGKRPGPMMQTTPRVKLDDPLAVARLLVDPPASLGDPSTEDVTARVLHGLAQSGFPLDSPVIASGIAFLQKQQCANGAWWGRWSLNYLSCTAFVLSGLAAVGADPNASWIRRAVRWVLARQNPDGGWGEGPESYRRPELAGVGPSMPPLTGQVLQGLIASGEGQSAAVARGIAYLVASQNSDGTWPNRDYLHVNVAPDTFFIDREATRFHPSAALGMYARAASTTGDRATPRWTDAQLDALRAVGDPPADAVVQAIFERGSLNEVNDLLGRIFRSDDPIPAGLPAEARRYFEQTRALPSWLDARQIATAQAFFTRAGWNLAMGLFCSSLPQAYAAAHGAHVLAQTQAMTRHVRQRIFETAQFLFDVADEGGLALDGRGVTSAQKVRLMHAGIRHLLLAREAPRWDVVRRGVPVNQEDLAGTLMTFSVVTLHALQRTGFAVEPGEGEAWLHLWKVVGHLLGIRDELLPDDLAQAEQLMETIRGRQWAPSDDGDSLTRALVAMMQEYFPGEAFDGLPIAVIRHLAGDQCADILGLPADDWTRVLLDSGALIGALVDDDLEVRLTKLFAHATNALMQGIVLAEREGKLARFRIPASLKSALGPER